MEYEEMEGTVPELSARWKPDAPDVSPWSGFIGEYAVWSTDIERCVNAAGTNLISSNGGTV